VNLGLEAVLGHPRSVLDVGCGRGQHGELARARGAHVVGIEASPELASEARARLDEVVLADVETDLALASLGARRFELILFGDVLEHTRDPLAVLARFCALLEDGGRVIVSLPNVAAWPIRLGLLAGRFDYQPSGILDRTHLRFFTRRSATALVEQAGLEVLHVGQNPLLARASLGLVKRAMAAPADGAASLLHSPAYRAYVTYVRPIEDRLAALAPGALAFQHVLVGRRAPGARPLSLTVGMISMNEAGAVGGVIDDIRAHAPDAEILLVDSSKDETPEIARARGARVVRQFPPCGYGPAMHRLLSEARGEVVVTMDCDGTYPAAEIPRLRRLVEDGADLVNATRTRRRPAAMPLANYLANRAFAGAARVLHGLPTTDVHSGMRAYRTSMLRALDLDPAGPALPVDLLVVPARLGYRIVELEIPYLDRIGTSSLQRLTSTVWTFRRLLRATRGGHRVRTGDVEQR
jgi:SAM-dependent methyltransferase